MARLPILTAKPGQTFRDRIKFEAKLFIAMLASLLASVTLFSLLLQSALKLELIQNKPQKFTVRVKKP